MTTNVCRVSLFGIFVLLLVGCTARERPGFDAHLVDDENSHAILGMDLRDETHPLFGLVVRGTPDSATSGVIAMPFETTSHKDAREWHTAAASYPACCTVVSFLPPNNGTGGFVLSFDPLIEQIPEETFDLASLRGTLYVKSDGRRHVFVYNYRAVQGNHEFQMLLKQGATKPESLVVILPEDADILEPGPDVARMLAPAVRVQGISRFYPAEIASGQAYTRLEVDYFLRVSRNTKVLADLGAKLVGELFAPLLALVFLKSISAGRSGIRITVILVCVILQTGVFLWLLYSAWILRDYAFSEAVGSVITSVIIAIVSTFGLWLKPNV